ncbi:single-stranded DNA-binding protein [Arsenicicoccus dermatophilus]|uniref:single-stranded DNA-binding protein n=1 Tax=Arsenicicoccus dermatophilus TaxID=1076331 RepID=UPI001F4CFD80|nr:single-stranded DNA-binding protein [Arsenicicoccus dermatophilus]MCH8613414.1 single-stranded DNA-binding protein [Arsenicicoccus dermatophilus]
MHESIVTVTGNLLADPELRITKTGDQFASFRLACTERRRDRNGVWGDGHTNIVRVTCFRTLAQNVMGSLGSGSRVVVTGRLRIATWETEERRGTSVEIDAHAIGAELTFAHGRLTRGVWSSVADRMDDAELQRLRQGDDGETSPGRPATQGYGGSIGPLVPAHDEQTGEVPDAEPGATAERDDLDTLTDEELALAGFTPAGEDEGATEDAADREPALV